ncbi:large ribosomal subunit protein eL39-like [Crocuta crocuta]
MSSHKTFRIKLLLAKRQKQNGPIPQEIQMKIDHKLRYNSTKSHWTRSELGL